MRLLSVNADAKTVKGAKLGYLTGIQYLAPSNVSGVINTCRCASKGCREACLFTAGRAGIFKAINEARVRKTKKLVADQTGYFADLKKDIISLVKSAEKKSMQPCVRLNGTSDLDWSEYQPHGLTIMQVFPTVQFYDYSKDFDKMMRYLNGQLPANYHLTFSRSESNDAEVLEVLKKGGNVAVVFDTIPDTYMGYKVVNGDETDLRFLDEKNVVIGLKAKGKAKKDNSGFVVK